MKSKQIRSSSDAPAATILLIGLTIIVVGCFLGISYLFQYNFYEKGDNGQTAKSVAVQIYSLDDCEKAKDYYKCYLDSDDEYRLKYYQDIFSPVNKNFVFTVCDIEGNTLFDSTDSSNYSYNQLKKNAVYTGKSDFNIIEGRGKFTPLEINYLIIGENEQTATDRYKNAFDWIEAANSLKYFVFFILFAAILIIVILLSIITINAGNTDKETGDIIPGFIDKMPLDICTIAVILFFIVAWMVMGLTSAADVDMVLNNLVVVITMVAFVMLLMSYLTTLSVRVKMGKIYKNTVFYMIYRKFKRKAPRKVRRAFGEMSFFKKTILGVSLYVVFEAAILISMAYAGIFGDRSVETFTMFLIIWGMTRLLIIPIFVMVAINLHYIKEEGERLAAGVLGEEISDKLTISAFKAYGRNLDQIRKEINKAMEQELKSERMRNELITNVTHDIKTPLTSIKSYVDFLQHDNITDEQRREYLEIVAKNADKLNTLAQNLVEVSRITSGNVEMNLEKTSLNIIIEQMTEEFALIMEQRELLPRINMPENEIFVMGDGEMLWRIFSNLLNNACKYAASGTDIEITLDRNDEKALIRIENISKSALNIEGDELLERFVRGDSSRHTEGNGLGLSIAKTLTELQKGSLEISVRGDKFSAVVTFDAIS